MKIAVAIPTFNEKDNIARLIKEILDLKIDQLEIIVIDDNSPDKTGDIVFEIAQNDSKIHLIRRPRKLGLGTAYIQAFKYALENGIEIIFEMDADFSHDPKDIPFFLEKIKKYDLVIGSRYLKGINIVNWPLHRLLLSMFANKYVKFITEMKLTDSTSGFKCFRRKVIESFNLDSIKSNGYSFQIEMNYKAYKKGFSIGEIPIIFIDRNSGKSKLSKNIIIEAILIVWKLRLGILK